MLLQDPHLHAGWAARIRAFDELGPPHLFMVSGRMAKEAIFLRRQWESDSLCGVYKVDGEILIQKLDGLPPVIQEWHHPDTKWLELIPVEGSMQSGFRIGVGRAAFPIRWNAGMEPMKIPTILPMPQVVTAEDAASHRYVGAMSILPDGEGQVYVGYASAPSNGICLFQRYVDMEECRLVEIGRDE